MNKKKGILKYNKNFHPFFQSPIITEDSGGNDHISYVKKLTLTKKDRKKFLEKQLEEFNNQEKINSKLREIENYKVKGEANLISIFAFLILIYCLLYFFLESINVKNNKKFKK